MAFILKQHDLEPKLRATLQNGDGTPINLATATRVKFIMNAAGSGTNKILADCTIISPIEGLVEYTWVSPNTDTTGNFNGEFEITWPTSRPQTVPNSGNFTITIEPDLG